MKFSVSEEKALPRPTTAALPPPVIPQLCSHVLAAENKQWARPKALLLLSHLSHQTPPSRLLWKGGFFCKSQLFGSHLRETHWVWDLPFCMDVLFLFSAGRRLLLKSVHIMNQTSCEVFINEGREFYQNNYTLCYICISILHEFSYFEISMSKQSYTGIFSIIILLVCSEWRPAFRHQGYFVGWKALLQTTIIFWLLAILGSLILLLIFTVSLFSDPSRVIFNYLRTQEPF